MNEVGDIMLTDQILLLSKAVTSNPEKCNCSYQCFSHTKCFKLMWMTSIAAVLLMRLHETTVY